ncbi:MAG: phosphate:Na+ symporter [Candidatus Omnitrophota bacterium]|jgi:phosphate:Na+ symporter
MEWQSVIFNTVGGLAIFLYGMKNLSEGLQHLAGQKLRSSIRAMTSTHFHGLLVGAGVTMIVQSSSVTTIMLVGLLNASVMTLKQSVGVIFGANIGTTITAQIIAFKVTKYALPMIAIGLGLNTFGKNAKLKFFGQVLISLSFIFIGLYYMKLAFEPLKHSEAVMHFCANLSTHPILAMLCGLVLTVIVQSSSASIGITIVMATTGLIDFNAALFILLGDNIGTTITAWIASIGSSLAARRMALVHTMFNITGAIYFGILITSGIYPTLVDRFTPGALAPDTIARHIANAHSAFNILNAIILTPFAGALAWIAIKVFKGDDTVVTGEPKFIDEHLLDTPEIAIQQVVKEMHHMSDLAHKNFTMACQAYLDDDAKKVKEVKTIENAVDALQQDITRYLVKLFGKHQASELSNQLPSLLHSVNDLEKISDHAESIAKLVEKRKESKYTLSDSAVSELKEIYESADKMFAHTTRILEAPDTSLASTIMVEEDKIDELKRTYIANHIARLKDKSCHPLAGLAFVAFINHVEKVSDHLKNIATAANVDFTYDQKLTTTN